MAESASNPIRVCIVGAGLAGASTAWHLSSHDGYAVTLLDMERLPGMHSSGRNAAMIRQIVEPAPVARMASESVRFLEETEGPSSGFRFTPNGSLLLGSQDTLQALSDRLSGQGALPDDSQLISRGQMQLEFGPLMSASSETAIATSSDGVVDVAGLLEFFIRESRARGVRLDLSTTVIDVVREGDRVTGVQTSEGFESFDVVVNAAGPWVGRLGALVGSTNITWRPMRRHLFFSGALDWVDPSMPFIWDIENDWYLRPESGGLLLSACDESEVEPGEPDIEPGVTQLLTEKLAQHLPELCDLPIARMWSGIRTFAPDRNFVIGWDDTVEGFFWVAGLGGHGVTCSWGIGACASRLLRHKADFGDRNFSPSRFSAETA